MRDIIILNHFASAEKYNTWLVEKVMKFWAEKMQQNRKQSIKGVCVGHKKINRKKHKLKHVKWHQNDPPPFFKIQTMHPVKMN